MKEIMQNFNNGINILLTLCLLSTCLIQFIVCQENVSEFKQQTEEICMEPDVKNFPLITLGYVTPWNTDGLEIALKYASKLDIVSPTYFSIKHEIFDNKFNVKIDGSNYVDNEFLHEIREINQGVKILPRFKCEDFTSDNLNTWMEKENTAQFIKILMRRLNYNKLDGIVFECNMIWMLESVVPKFEIFLKNLYEALKGQGKFLILTVFPFSEVFVHYLTKARFEEASKYVDYFNIMTYDYYNYQSYEKENIKIFNSPYSWIEKSIEHYVDLDSKNKDTLLKKILLGIPFHGANVQMDQYKPKFGILDGRTITVMLNREFSSSMKWDEKEKENTFYFTDNDKNYLALFPTNKFIKERLNFAIENKLGGVGVWELGQGIDYFLEEF